MKTSHVITLNIFITLLLLGGFYYSINRYGTEFLTGVWDKNGVTKVINQKVIQENVNEYRKLSETQSDITKAIDLAAPSVMHIVRSSDLTSTLSGAVVSSIQGGGTAIIISSDGYLITNKHVIGNIKDSYAAVSADGKKLPVSNIRLDPVLDLAILKVTDATGKALTNLPAASFISNGSSLHLGSFAIILGSNQNSISLLQTMGTISQIGISFNVTTGDNTNNLPYFKIDTSVQPGFSGGPTLDLQGNVIGMTTAMDNTQPGALILPLSRELIQQSLESILSQGKIQRNVFGATMLNLNTYLADKLALKKFNGFLVQKIMSGSAASNAGLQVGDIITQIDSNDVSSEVPFPVYWLGYGSGDNIGFTVYRNDSSKKLSVTLR